MIHSSVTHERVRRVYGYMQDLPMAVELPERTPEGLLGLRKEKEHEYRERLSREISAALTGIVLRHDLDSRNAADEIAGLTRRLKTTERDLREAHEAVAVGEKARLTVDRILTAYEATGRMQELVDTVNDYEQAAHDRQQAEIEAEQQRQRHERVRQQELDHERPTKALRKKQELKLGRQREKDLDFDL